MYKQSGLSCGNFIFYATEYPTNRLPKSGIKRGIKWLVVFLYRWSLIQAWLERQTSGKDLFVFKRPPLLFWVWGPFCYHLVPLPSCDVSQNQKSGACLFRQARLFGKIQYIIDMVPGSVQNASPLHCTSGPHIIFSTLYSITNHMLFIFFKYRHSSLH